MNDLFAAILIFDVLAIVAMLCAVFPNAYRAPIRAYHQLRTALLFRPVTRSNALVDRLARATELEPSFKTASKLCIAGDGSCCDDHQHVTITQTGFVVAPARAVVHFDASWDDATPTSPRRAA